jgi:putative peptidoglycan lipid II flippase
MQDSAERATWRIARAAAVVMAGMALSSLAGLATTVLVSRAFGTSADLDAFYAANRLPEILFNLMAGGALASAFVPTFTGLLTVGDRPSAWRLASAIGNSVLLILSATAALAWLAAPWLVTRILAPGFNDPAQWESTVRLLRIMLISPVIFGVSGLLMGILNAHQRFFLPALAPACYRLGWLLGLILLVPRFGIEGLAWGVVLGAGLHLLVQVPGLRGLTARYRPGLGWGEANVRHVGRLMLPRLLGVAVVQLNFLVNTILASAMPEGSVTSMALAFSLMLVPQAVVAQATAIAALPTLSAQVARGALDEMRHSLVTTLRGVLFLALPASLGIILLRVPLVALALQRGAFTAQSTSMVSWALLWYAAGLLGHALLEVIVRAFYAMHDTRTPVLVGALSMGLNVLLSLVLWRVFLAAGWMPHGALALANSLATALETTVLLVLIARRVGGLELGQQRRGLLAAFGAAGVMVLALLLWNAASQGLSPWASGLGGVAVGAAVYALASLALGAPEARHLVRRLTPHRPA